jgi:hypothetical protein
LGERLGLVRGTDTVRFGLALGVGLWLVVVALSLVEGVTDRLFELSVIGGHVRLLLVIPLLFVCESWVAPLMTPFIATIASNGVVPPRATPALDTEVRRANRLANAWWPDVTCLLIAMTLAFTGSRLHNYGETVVADMPRTALAAEVYFRLGVTLCRFLLFRWVFKIGLWSWLLWRVSRLDLCLMPGHPDRAGGLGSLEGVHERFTPLVAALSIIECASMAESISTGTLVVTAVHPWVTMLLLIDGALFISPLLVFTDKLWASRTLGLWLYMKLAGRYVTAFETKWIVGPGPTAAPLLGTPDIQSLADLNNAINVVKGMRWVTAGPRMLTMMLGAALVPFSPLLLFQYPVGELTQKVLSKLVGF